MLKGLKARGQEQGQGQGLVVRGQDNDKELKSEDKDKLVVEDVNTGGLYKNVPHQCL